MFIDNEGLNLTKLNEYFNKIISAHEDLYLLKVQNDNINELKTNSSLFAKLKIRVMKLLQLLVVIFLICYLYYFYVYVKIKFIVSLVILICGFFNIILFIWSFFLNDSSAILFRGSNTQKLALPWTSMTTQTGSLIYFEKSFTSFSYSTFFSSCSSGALPRQSFTTRGASPKNMYEYSNANLIQLFIYPLVF